MTTRSIDIDIDVHRHIEQHRTSFGQTPNDILRALFGLPSTVGNIEQTAEGLQPIAGWTWKGVTLPGATELRMTYKGKTHTGVVSGGVWQISGASYTSPTSAATALAGAQINGWKQWEFRRPGSDTWVLLDTLRPSNSQKRRRSRRSAA